MREILFRGKRIDNGEWAEGYFGIFKDSPQIFVPFTAEQEKRLEGHIFSAIGGLWHLVILKTVGQYTGLTDKNGRRIFEGDIVKSDNWKYAVFSVVKYGDFEPRVFYDLLEDVLMRRPKEKIHGLYAKTTKGEDVLLTNCPRLLEVIGNIHDNPELMEGAQK